MNRVLSRLVGIGVASAMLAKCSWPIPVRLRLASNRTTPGTLLGLCTTATG